MPERKRREEKPLIMSSCWGENPCLRQPGHKTLRSKYSPDDFLPVWKAAPDIWWLWEYFSSLSDLQVQTRPQHRNVWSLVWQLWLCPVPGSNNRDEKCHSDVDWWSFSTHHAPVVVNLVQSHRVEHNAGHYFGQNGPVLDEPVVVRGGLLVDDAHDPLQHLPLQLQVFLKRKENMNVDWDKGEQSVSDNPSTCCALVTRSGPAVDHEFPIWLMIQWWTSPSPSLSPFTLPAVSLTVRWRG